MTATCLACQKEFEIPEEIVRELEKPDQENKFFDLGYIVYRKEFMFECPDCNGYTPQDSV